MLSKEPIPLRVILLTLLRAWVCVVVVSTILVFALVFVAVSPWEEPVSFSFLLAPTLLLGWVVYLLMKNVWDGGVAGPSIVAIFGAGALGLNALVMYYSVADLESPVVPLRIHDLINWETIFRAGVLLFGPLCVSLLLTGLKKRQGMVSAAREDHARAIIRISYVVVLLGVGHYLLRDASAFIASIASFQIVGLFALLFRVVFPAAAWGTWRYHLPSTKLLAVCGVPHFADGMRILGTFEESWENFGEELSLQLVTCMPYFVPLIVLWWVGRKPQRGAEAGGSVEETGGEQPC